MTSHASPAPSTSDEFTGWLRDGWKIMLAHFPALVLIALVADVPLTFIRRAAADIDNGFLSVLLTTSAIAIITPLAKAAAIVAIDRWENGGTGVVAESLGTLVGKAHLLVAASIMWCVAVFAGMALFIVPGIIVLMLGQCLMGSIIIEQRSLADAARRSVALVKPRFFAVFGLFLLVQMVAGITSSIVEGLVGLVVDGIFLDLIVGATTSPIVFAPLAVMFLRTSGRGVAVAA